MGKIESSRGGSTEPRRTDNEDINSRYGRLSALAEARQNNLSRLDIIALKIGLELNHHGNPNEDDKPLTVID